MKSSISKGMIIFLFIALVGFIGSKLYFDNQVGPVNADSNKNVMLEITKGSSTSQIAAVLKEEKVIKNDLAFRILSKIVKADGKMKAGKFLLNTSMSANDIIHILVQGDVVKDTIKFTIPEGFELRQIADRLYEKGLIDKEKFIEIANNGDFDYKFLKDIPKGENRLEGYLFPDTYEVSKDVTEKELIVKMLNRFDAVFEEAYYERTAELNMDINQIITIASIIEREAKLDEERSIVSSVFHNRIRKGMLLQSCATVQYILGERKENLSLKDIEIDSPYNTYKYEGLPPKPIASPGKASIEAALYPEKTDYLYFVVSKNGKHTFSKTYQEHLNAKNGN
ncbi:endolytic transglycosylase MltG [Clostridiaceae bacterium 35-E11]